VGSKVIEKIQEIINNATIHVVCGGVKTEEGTLFIIDSIRPLSVLA